MKLTIYKNSNIAKLERQYNTTFFHYVTTVYITVDKLITPKNSPTMFIIQGKKTTIENILFGCGGITDIITRNNTIRNNTIPSTLSPHDNIRISIGNTATLEIKEEHL